MDETLIAGAGPEGAPCGTLPMCAGDLEVGLWRYPFDPTLHGLRDAVSVPRLDDLVGRHTGPLQHVRVRTYRPGRRAVVHVTGSRADAFVKVVAPGAAARALIERHEQLGRTLPVPEVVAADVDRGLVALRALPGEGLRPMLRGGVGPWPDTHALTDLIDRFAAAGPISGARAVNGRVAAAPGHAQLLMQVMPTSAPTIHGLLDEIGHAATGARASSVTVHGDLHEAQLLVAGSAIAGVLDLDDAGPGDPLDDRATYLGHVSTLALDGPARNEIMTYALELHRQWSREIDGGELTRRTAAAVLGLATGPFRVQQPQWRQATRVRLALAHRWLGRTE